MVQKERKKERKISTSLSCYADLLDRVDAVRGSTSRSAWIETAIEAALKYVETKGRIEGIVDARYTDALTGHKEGEE